MAAYQHIVILTGAGLSKESGLATFRDADGLWETYKIEDVATIEGYMRNPGVVLEFYNERRRRNAGAKPNAAHFALATLEQHYPGNVLIVTQNIDPLHAAAGARNIVHMHGEILKALCSKCGERHEWGLADIELTSVCPLCGAEGRLRPDVVWFGEMPYHMDRISAALSRCDLFLSIGTSGTVYPAAGFVALARQAGAQTIELNLEPSESVSLFHQAVHGPATQVVPAVVDKLLREAAAPQSAFSST